LGCRKLQEQVRKYNLLLNRSSSEEVVKLFDDYFAWKVDTYKFKYYIDGFNVHPGELDDLNLERYQIIENACKDYHNRANEILNRRGNELKVRPHCLDLDLNGLLTRRNFGCIPGMLGTYTIPK
jgi:hypothetical protein